MSDNGKTAPQGAKPQAPKPSSPGTISAPVKPVAPAPRYVVEGAKIPFVSPKRGD